MENSVIYHGGKEKYVDKIVIIDGELMLETPEHYERTYTNETGGITKELSLTPFEDETTKEHYSR